MKTRKCRTHGVLTEGMFEIYEVYWSIQKKTRCMLCMAVCEKDSYIFRVKEEIRKEKEDEENRQYWINWKNKEIALEKRKQDGLWDCVVKKELVKGMQLKGDQKYLFMKNIPKEVLQLKRAQMKLDRLIKSKQEKINELEEEKKQKEEEEELKKQHDEYIKIGVFPCKKHGNVKHIKSGKDKQENQLYKCSYCYKEVRKKHYENNKENILKKCEEYRRNNPEKIKEIRQKYKETISVKNN